MNKINLDFSLCFNIPGSLTNDSYLSSSGLRKVARQRLWPLEENNMCRHKNRKVSRWQILTLILIGLPYLLVSTRQICQSWNVLNRCGNQISEYCFCVASEKKDNFRISCVRRIWCTKDYLYKIIFFGLFDDLFFIDFFFCILDKVCLVLNNELLLFHELCGG